MRKILLCLLLVFPLTGPMTGPTYSGEKEFGPSNMHNGCRMGINEGYREALSKKKPSENIVVYGGCLIQGTGGWKYTWWWDKGKDIEKLHKNAYQSCMENKYYKIEDCYLFAVNDKEVWKEVEQHTYVLTSTTETISKAELKKKKTLYDDTSFQFNILAKIDPTTFLTLEYVGQKDTTMVRGLPTGGTENCRDCESTKYKDVYVFKAHYEDDHNVTIKVHPDVGKQEKVEKIASNISRVIGQLPNFFRKSYQSVHISKGNRRMAAHGMGLVSVGYGYSMSGHNAKYLEEGLLHESGHTTLDWRIDNDLWQAFQAKDPKFVSKYAKEFPNREDIAETLNAWIAVRCKADRISKSDYKKIIKAIPNRLNYLDKQGYDMYPLVCN